MSLAAALSFWTELLLSLGAMDIRRALWRWTRERIRLLPKRRAAKATLLTNHEHIWGLRVRVPQGEFLLEKKRITARPDFGRRDARSFKTAFYH